MLDRRHLLKAMAAAPALAALAVSSPPWPPT